MQLGLGEIEFEILLVFLYAKLFGGPIDVLLADSHLGGPWIPRNVRIGWGFYLTFVAHKILTDSKFDWCRHLWPRGRIMPKKWGQQSRARQLSGEICCWVEIGRAHV